MLTSCSALYKRWDNFEHGINQNEGSEHKCIRITHNSHHHIIIDTLQPLAQYTRNTSSLQIIHLTNPKNKPTLPQSLHYYPHN